MAKKIIEDGTVINSFDDDYITKIIEETNNYYEKTLLDFVSQNIGDGIILDIGANVGNHTLYFAQKFPNNQIHSFEPADATFKILKQNIIENDVKNVKLWNNAVSDKEDSFSLVVVDAKNMGGNKVEKDENGEIKSVVIDKVIEQKVSFVKIDVEGFEVSVIRGMEKILSEQSFHMMIEVNPDNYSDIAKVLSKYHYYPVKCFGSQNFLFKKVDNISKSLFEIVRESYENRKLAVLDVLNNTEDIEEKDASYYFNLSEYYKRVAEGNAWQVSQDKMNLSRQNEEIMQTKELLSQAEKLSEKYKYQLSETKKQLNQVEKLSKECKHQLSETKEKHNQAEKLSEEYKYQLGETKEKLNQAKKLSEEYKYQLSEAKEHLNLEKQLSEKCNCQLDYTNQKLESAELKLKNALSEIEKLKVQNEKLEAQNLEFYLRCDKYLKKMYQYELESTEKSRIIDSFFDTEKYKKIQLINRGVVAYSLSHIEWMEERLLGIDERVKKKQKAFNHVLKNADDEKLSFFDIFSKSKVVYITDRTLEEMICKTANAIPYYANDNVEKIRGFAPDYFICESAYLGPEREDVSWKGKLYFAPKYPNLSQKILNTIDYCKKNNITTIYINNRDDVDPNNENIDYGKIASQFDLVFSHRNSMTMALQKRFPEMITRHFRAKATNGEVLKKIQSYSQQFTVSNLKEIKAVSILDEFSYNAFSGVMNITQLSPENYREQIAKLRPQIFICESTWSGYIDGRYNDWRGKIYASENFNYENRKELLDIIKICKENYIKTIFWNKEDPTHFHDKVNNFVETAKLFDYIYTTAKECVDSYKKLVEDAHVGCLEFGTPIIDVDTSIKNNEKATFFGSWYTVHEQRCVETEVIFDMLIDNGFELEIYDRTLASKNDSSSFPSKYNRFIKPKVTQNQVWDGFAKMKYGINISTVVDSESMVARRVFEMAYCKILIISNYSVALEKMFGDSVIILPRDINKLINLTEDKYQEMVSNAYNIVINKHIQGSKIIDMLIESKVYFNDEVRYVFRAVSEKEIESIPKEINTICIITSENKNFISNMHEKYHSPQTHIVDIEFLNFNYGELYFDGEIGAEIPEIDRKIVLSGLNIKTNKGKLFRGDKYENCYIKR